LTASKTFLEFFAGVGLVHLGLRRSGWECVYANDISEKKKEMYFDEFPGAPYFHREDIWNTESVLKHISIRASLATASFPCIDLSLAGQMKGLEGKHSGTLFGFLRVMHRLKERGLMPPTLMVENVVGLVSGKNGEEFKRTCRAVAELGYYLDAMIIDAKHFTPQSRPRLFIIGITHEAILPHVQSGDAWAVEMERRNGAVGKKLYDVMKATQLDTGWIAFPLPPLPPVRTDIAKFIDTDSEQAWWSEEEVTKHLDRTSKSHRQQIEQQQLSGQTWIGTAFRRIREGTTRVEVRFDGIAGCLRTANGGSARQILVMVQGDSIKMRWMTPREYARLQGAPDFNIRRGINQSLTGFGDGVCVPVIEWIDKQVISAVCPPVETPQQTPQRIDSQAQLSLL
jgi:DNA (cytosine-5)-methyltransferase 1